MPVPLGTNCSEGTLTGQLVAAQSPIVLAARLTDAATLDNDNLAIVPTSVADTAFVTSHYADHLVKVGPAGVSVQATGVCGFTVQLIVDNTDAAALLASTEDPGTNTTFDRFYSIWTSAQPTWSADYVVKATVTTGSYGVVDGDLGVGAIIDGAGQLRVVVSDAMSGGLRLYDRVGQAMWISTTTVAASGSMPEAVVDSLGRLRIVYTALDSGDYYHFSEWTDGTTIADFRKDTHYSTAAIAAGLSGMLAVARVTTNGIVVTFSDGATVSDDHLVPNTEPPPAGDPCYTTSPTCTPLVCKREGISPDSVALTATSFGAMWLTYRYIQYTDEYTVNGTNPQYCWVLSKESTTDDLVLVRLSADGSSARSGTWSYTRSGPTADPRPVALAAQGTRLFLAIPDLEAADVFVVDSTKL